jgi:hypothetical protein
LGFSLIIVGHINNMDARPCLLANAGVQVKWDIKHPGDALLLTEVGDFGFARHLGDTFGFNWELICDGSWRLSCVPL